MLDDDDVVVNEFVLVGRVNALLMVNNIVIVTVVITRIVILNKNFIVQGKILDTSCVCVCSFNYKYCRGVLRV